jgi:hypothetical protein
MLTAIVLLTAGITGAVVSLARLCRDLMIGRLIRRLLAEASPDQRFAICERLAAALGSGDCVSEQGSPGGTGGRTLPRRVGQSASANAGDLAARQAMSAGACDGG